MIMLDLFAGRLGWAKAFAARGWECVAVDLTEPSEIPQGVTFIQCDVLKILDIWEQLGYEFDFICASPPCEQFSVHGMKLFHPNPPYPDLGVKLFNHTRQICEQSGVPYVIENVRPAQAFVGQAQHHCGPFYLWGTGVPPLVNQGITKGSKFGRLSRQERKEQGEPYYRSGSKSKARADIKAKMATIPPELANCVAEYAERLAVAR